LTGLADRLFGLGNYWRGTVATSEKQEKKEAANTCDELENQKTVSRTNLTS
jgi:hypothetical protein